MITDANNTFGTALDITSTSNSVTEANGNILKLDNADFGKGKKLDVVFIIQTSVAAGTSIQFYAQTSDSATFASGNVKLAQTDVIAVANLKSGTEIRITLNGDVLDYLQVGWTVVGSPSAGTAAAFLVAQ